MTLLKNISSTAQGKGPYTIEPGCWGVLPPHVVGSWDNDERFIVSGSTDKPDVLIYAGCPITTTGGGQHPTQIARALARAGHRVIYVQNTPAEDPELIVLGNPNLFSNQCANRGQIVEQDYLIHSLSPDTVVLFTFPSAYCASVASYLKQEKRHLTTAYWCLDDWTAINAGLENRQYSPGYEVLLSQVADHLVATADPLGAHLQIISGRSATVIPNGYSPINFPEAAAVCPEDLVRGEKTLVYWGELGGAWFDWDLIAYLSEQHPTWQINLIGPDGHCGRPVVANNVHYLGEKPVSELAAYGQHARFGLIPFKRDAVSKAVNPIKVYEYLASGLFPVGPAHMDELRKFPNALIYDSPQQAASLIEYPRLPGLQPFSSASEFLDASTWNARAQQFLEVVCPSRSMQPLAS